MNSSRPLQKETGTYDDADAAHDDDDREPTPTRPPPPTRPSAQQSLSDARPHLVRSPPGRLSELGQPADNPQQTSTAEMTDGSSDDGGAAARGAARGKPTVKRGSSASATPSGKQMHGASPQPQANLADFKDALKRAEVRPRRSYGTPGTPGLTKRVSPIQEEASGDSPNISINTILGTTEPVRTTSTESTESAQTIRGSALPTPSGNFPLRTPSYPFPYVPGTPQSWPHNLHQPFMTLSPTVAGPPGPDEADTPGASSFNVRSGGNTPVANSSFMPGGMRYEGLEDPRYPTPNLYDLVLQLNTEPGLEQWWTTVTNILHDHFLAERATLVQPLDPNDIENVPWGQKATFSMNGREDFVAPSAFDHLGSHRPDIQVREPSTETLSNLQPQKLHPERLRPRLETRHSYAGHGREVRDILGVLNTPPIRGPRPQGPQRTVTHAAGITPLASSGDIQPKRFPSVQTGRHGSLNDPNFSSFADLSDAGPYAEIFSSIRPLDQEANPLIESQGVCRVLDRGRIVTITRDYSGDENLPSVSRSAPAASYSMGITSRRRASSNAPQPDWGYDEYEQHPPSPWSQSPAPSPAIQADEEINPFFASDDQLMDESFNPNTSPKDYSQYDQVEAIGIDHASTVIHIPLIHPTLSQPMQALRMTPSAKDSPPNLSRRGTVDLDRKSPIAILSLLTANVPYPVNLANALKLLGPHLATSLQNAKQFSSTYTRAVNIRQRRTTDGDRAKSAPMMVEPASLEDIVDADLEEPPGSESMTSPSDYSGRSRISPTGSIVGTPGWDPAAHGWTASKSRGGTPAITGSEMVDNYFDARIRSGHRSGSNASNTITSTSTPAKATSKASSNESQTEGDAALPRGQRKARAISNSKPGKTPMQPASSANSSSPTADSSSTQFPDLNQPNKRHSLLHSYGADFETTFGGLQASTPANAQGSGHGRKGSYSEDMPPPSERLLRTIIDSVPVQIFTAQPETGHLSWVNSKFLIYRGQDPAQVLTEPWAAIHPHDHREFLPAWQRSLRTNQQLQQKVRLKRFDGAYRWFYVRAAPLKDKKQKVVHWIGTLMDFHEQQIAEINAARQQETAASEAKYRALANSSPQIVFAVNKTRGVTFCNTQWLQYSGQTEAQALGAGFMEHVHPDDLVKCKLPSFDSETNKFNVPTTLPPEPMRTASHSESSTTDSNETEKPSSDSTSASGSSASPIQQMPQRKLSHLASAGLLKVSRDTDGRPSYSTEVRLKSSEGDYRWHLVRVLIAEPLLQHEDEEETWYGTCTDINDHKDLERDLKNTMDAKSRFLSNMSHEIRTPLNGITGMVNFLIDSSLSAEQMEHVNIIRASTEGLRGLINDILDLSKAEAGMIQLNMDWVYVRALIEEVNDLTSAMAIDKGLELNYIVDEDVPPQIKGDRFRIRQILLNVVGNAIKFTQKGEVFIRCSIRKAEGRLADDEMLIKFDVIDTGQGFTDEEADSLFKRFSQIDGSSTRQHGGTGLGLVISKQLAQLHGGDMSAKGVPDKGSTFSFYIKTTLPSSDDRPPMPLPTPGPGPVNVPVLPVSPTPDARPRFASEVTATPPQYPPTPSEAGSPSVSSASSDPSLRSVARTESLRSERSSVSSVSRETIPAGAQIKLSLPSHDMTLSRSDSLPSRSIDAVAANSLLKPHGSSPPPMFSILVIAPLKYTREATVHHIDKTLPGNVPHQITARESLLDCQRLLAGPEPVTFTHIVAVLQDVTEITELMNQVLSTASPSTSIVLITDLAQRRNIMEQAPHHNYDQLVTDRRLRFVFKPLKPSRFGLIFDPQKEREMSLDRNQDSAQQVAVNQKQVFEELARRLGNKGKRVLLVEDNKVNQMVILKFLSKVSIKVDTVMDGVQCTDKVLAQPPNFYSIILCDLHMPNKDGYQTCKEIRKWERTNQYAHLPIIALSANVLGDVYQKCVDAGFNSYMTKPVDFKELSQVLMTFMDPSDPSKPHAFMKLKHGQQSHRSKDKTAQESGKDKSKKGK